MNKAIYGRNGNLDYDFTEIRMYPGGKAWYQEEGKKELEQEAGVHILKSNHKAEGQAMTQVIKLPRPTSNNICPPV